MLHKSKITWELLEFEERIYVSRLDICNQIGVCPLGQMYIEDTCTIFLYNFFKYNIIFSSLKGKKSFNCDVTNSISVILRSPKTNLATPISFPFPNVDFLAAKLNKMMGVQKEQI